MTKFCKVTSTDYNKTPTIINLEHVVMIQPLGNGECTSFLLDTGSYFIVDIPYDVEAELLSEYIVDVNICNDEEKIKRATELHEQFKEVFSK